MKVKELIAELVGHNPEAEVMFARAKSHDIDGHVDVIHQEECLNMLWTYEDIGRIYLVP